MLIWILVSTFLISTIAFIGAISLFLKEKYLNKILLILVAFSAGALIGGAFLHLLPEAISKAGVEESFSLFLYLILGFCTSFILEQFIGWHHHHTLKHVAECKIKPFSYLILIGDSIHNFIDGLIIATSFIINFSIGIVTTIAIALHEIPQELGDYGVLVYGGFKKRKALMLNYLSAITVIFGGIAGYLLSNQIGPAIIFLLPFTAGNFIYIASADLIPEIKHKVSIRKSLIHFFAFLAGICFMLMIKLL
ncbi:MAG TPA: ZIP family metal transporter [Candidatus Aenigmarchaeota archaeon]|nr:ZIP family metal transporter [Candidatus Aenigmarchaeota archaeon]